MFKNIKNWVTIGQKEGNCDGKEVNNKNQMNKMWEYIQRRYSERFMWYLFGSRVFTIFLL